MSILRRALNPLAPVTSEAEAVEAARVSALAIALGVIWGCISLYMTMTVGQEAMQAALSQVAPQSGDAADMSALAYQSAIGIGVVVIAIQLVLGLVQWFRPNAVIPIIFVILVAYGLLSGLAGIAMSNSMGLATATATPDWLIWVGFGVLVIELVMHVTGVRGGSALSKFRQD